MFNINQFKAVMGKYGGPAKTNLFVLEISDSMMNTTKTKYISKSDLRFFCTDVSMPSININTAPYKANVIDIAQAMPINLTTPSINANFMLDSDHKVIAFFHSWIQEIINYDVSQGNLTLLNGEQLPYEIGYKSDYACDITVKHYRTDATNAIEELYEYKFYNAFPTEIGGKIFSWTPNGPIATSTINFSAASFSFTGSDPGNTISNYARGNGHLEFLNSVGFYGQTVQQRNLPRTVQDAINTFTKVKTDFKQFRSSLESLRNIF
jgi:hypothetical protein